MKTVFLSFSIADSSLTDFFIELSNLLSKKFNVIIITDNIRHHSFSISPQIKILKWPSNRPKKFKDFYFLYKTMRSNRPEMMISIFGAVNIFLIVGFLLGINHRIVWRRSISDQFSRNPKLEFRKKYIYKLANLIIANSFATKEDLIKNFGVNNKKIKIVPNAVRDYSIYPKTIDKNKIVYAGRMHTSKGVGTLLQAIPIIIKSYPDTHFVLIGGPLNGKEVKQYKETVLSLDISRQVTFLGFQERKKVLEEFSSAYLTVVPSLIEAFGFVVIESFAVKTPVIGSNTSGISEIIRDGVDGFLFRPEDPNDLAIKILFLLGDDNLREKFSLNCYSRFLEKFELRSSTKNLYIELQKLMEC